MRYQRAVSFFNQHQPMEVDMQSRIFRSIVTLVVLSFPTLSSRGFQEMPELQKLWAADSSTFFGSPCFLGSIQAVFIFLGLVIKLYIWWDFWWSPIDQRDIPREKGVAR